MVFAHRQPLTSFKSQLKYHLLTKVSSDSLVLDKIRDDFLSGKHVLSQENMSNKPCADDRSGRGRGCLTAQQFCLEDWEGSSGGREGASQEAGGSRAAMGAVGPAAMRWGEGQGQSRSGRTREPSVPPAAPTLVGESVVGWALPAGCRATAPWG